MLSAYSILIPASASSKQMNIPPTSRTPYEVWERILLNVILVSTPVLEVTCTPSTYLAFKRTCGDGNSTVYQHEYRIAEKLRRNLRLVCRSWNEFADRWDTRERWMRCWSLRKELSDERWRGFQRVEFVSGTLYMHHLASVLFNWKIMGISGGSGMRLRRLEMLCVTVSEFGGVFQALCDASSVLRELRSLGLAIPCHPKVGGNGWPLRRLSKCFPELLHLTLRACFDEKIKGNADEVEEDTVEDGMPGENQYDTLNLKNLEVLFLFPSIHRFRLSTWSLPSLKHFHVRPVTTMWKSSVFPFLARHADTIETLDLDNELDDSKIRYGMPFPSSTYDPRTIDFWGIFPRLAFLRCNLGRRRFATYPREQHALECFANIGSIQDAEDLINALSPWVEEYGVKNVRSLVLFGPYLSGGYYKMDKGVVRGLLQQCQWNGIRLVNPAGRSWIDPL